MGNIGVKRDAFVVFEALIGNLLFVFKPGVYMVLTMTHKHLVFFRLNIHILNQNNQHIKI